VEVTPEFLSDNPEVAIQLGTRRVEVSPGWHFGSAFPGHPDRLAVYDFVPDALIATIANLREFLGILVFDKWMGNADARQSIFFRARVRQWLPASDASPQKQQLVALMMDHGYVFDGPHWRYSDGPLFGLYFRPIVYQNVRGFDDFQPWLDQVVHFPEEVVDQAAKQVPPEWIDGDEDLFQDLLERLMRRRKRVPDLIRGCVSGRVNPFPNWK
jgi:hypothetical protein